MARRFFDLAVIVALVGGITAIIFFCRPLGEDPRVTYDKEGRYLPVWSLRDLALAMHAYHEKHGEFPPAALCDANGKPLLSWRVLILPYLEGEPLFREFKLDEAWDSPHNIKLLRKRPVVYAPLEGAQESDTTHFQVFVGKGTPFEGRRGWRLKVDIPRPSYTVLIAEAAKGVPWTKPEDIPNDGNGPLPKLGAMFEGRFHVAMADASTRGFRTFQVEEADLRSAILRDGNGDWPWDR
jgi:hypothetical protein